MSFKRILSAIDFSENSLESFQVALEMARLNHGSLYVLHVIEAQPVIPNYTEFGEMGEATIGIVEKAGAAMEALISPIKGIPITTQVTSGRALIEILNYSKKWSIDLIVIGARGTPSLKEVFMGSTAENVTKEAKCSVLITRR